MEKEFLKQTLDNWQRRFEGICLKYVHDIGTDYHLIEVAPESIRRGNKEYMEAELALWLEFMERFPNSDLLIIGTKLD